MKIYNFLACRITNKKTGRVVQVLPSKRMIFEVIKEYDTYTLVKDCRGVEFFIKAKEYNDNFKVVP